MGAQAGLTSISTNEMRAGQANRGASGLCELDDSHAHNRFIIVVVEILHDVHAPRQRPRALDDSVRGDLSLRVALDDYDLHRVVSQSDLQESVSILFKCISLSTCLPWLSRCLRTFNASSMNGIYGERPRQRVLEAVEVYSTGYYVCCIDLTTCKHVAENKCNDMDVP